MAWTSLILVLESIVGTVAPLTRILPYIHVCVYGVYRPIIISATQIFPIAELLATYSKTSPGGFRWGRTIEMMRCKSSANASTCASTGTSASKSRLSIASLRERGEAPLDKDDAVCSSLPASSRSAGRGNEQRWLLVCFWVYWKRFPPACAPSLA